MSNIFNKVKEAALGKAEPQSEKVVEVVEDVGESQQAPPVVKNLPPPEPPPKIKPSELEKAEAIAKVKKAFEAGEQVWVIALSKGEHPKGIWNKEGSKFRLRSAQAYSHRWMKLA